VRCKKVGLGGSSCSCSCEAGGGDSGDDDDDDDNTRITYAFLCTAIKFQHSNNVWKVWSQRRVYSSDY
jgi:hypothetical protein